MALVTGERVGTTRHPRPTADGASLSARALQPRCLLPGSRVLAGSVRIAEGGGGVEAVASHLRHKDLQTASDYVDRRRGSAGAIHALETSGRRTSEHS